MAALQTALSFPAGDQFFPRFLRSRDTLGIITSKEGQKARGVDFARRQLILQGQDRNYSMNHAEVFVHRLRDDEPTGNWKAPPTGQRM